MRPYGVGQCIKTWIASALMLASAIHAGGQDLDKIHVDDGLGNTGPSAIKIDSGDDDRIKPSASNTDLNLGANGAGNKVQVNSGLVVGATGTPKGVVVFGDSSFNDEAGPYPLEVWPNMKDHTRAAPTPYPGATPTPYPTATPTPYPGTEIYPTPYPTGAPTAYPTDSPTPYPTITPAISAANMQTPLFFVNTSVQDDHRIENAVEAWGTFESYWTADFWGEKPPPEVDSRFPFTGFSHGAFRAMNLWPLSQARSEEILAINRMTKGSYALVRKVADRETIGGNVTPYPALSPYGHLGIGHMDDAAYLWGNLHVWRAHQKYHQYDDHTEVTFLRDDFKLRRSSVPYNPASSTYPYDQVEGDEDDHTLYPWIDRELGQPQFFLQDGVVVGEPLKDKEIVAVTAYKGKLHGPSVNALTGEMVSMMVMADGDHDVVNTGAGFVGSSPGQIVFLTRPPHDAIVPETGYDMPLLPALAIRAKGEVVLGFQELAGASDDPNGSPPDQKLPDHVTGQRYSLQAPQDRLHVHNNYAGQPSAVRFTNVSTGFPTPENGNLGLRVGLGDDLRGLIWNFEAADLAFATDGTERMRIDPAGNVGIGLVPTDEIDAKLEVAGAVLVSDWGNFGGDLVVGDLATILGSGEIGGSLKVGDFTGALSTGDLGIEADLGVEGRADVTGGIASGGTITAATSLGVGTTSPTAALDVRGSGEKFLVKANSPTNYVTLNVPDSHMKLDSGGSMEFEVYDIYDNYRFDDGQGVATLFLENLQNSVGIGGTETPQAHLHVHDGATDHASWLMFTNDTTGDDAFSEGFHVGLDASENGTLWSYEETSILFGTDNTRALRIDDNQNVILGDSASADSSAGMNLVLEAGTEPGGATTDAVHIWAELDGGGVARLHVMDESGTDNVITAHDRTLLPAPPSDVAIPWTSFQKNRFLGVEQNVDLAAVVREVEELSGKTFLHSRELPPDERVDWVADQLAQKERVEAARVADCMTTEVEIPKTEALVVAVVTTKVPRTVIEIHYELDLSSGEVLPVTRDRIVYDEVPTGQGWALAAGVRFDSKTGTFHRHKTEDECRLEIEPYQPRTPPDWMVERM